MKKRNRLLAASLLTAILLGLLNACELTREQPAQTEPPAPASEEPSPSPTPEPKDETLKVACSDLEGDFSPFTAESGGDLDVVGMTQLPLLTLSRSGAVVYRGIEGETMSYNGADYRYAGPADISVTRNYDGTATLHIRLRDDLRFSDGRPLTVDDLIFSYYVYLDPSYSGPGLLSASRIKGLRDYQTGTPGTLFDQYAAVFDEIYNNGEYGDDPRADEVREAIKEAWIDSVRGIVDYCAENYMSYANVYTDYEPEEILASEGLKVMFGMYMWNFADFDADGGLVGSVTGKKWDLQTEFPTAEDFYNECYAAYAGDPVSYWTIELGSGTDVVSAARSSLAARWAAMDPAYSGPVRSVSGLVRVDDYSLDLVVTDFAASDVYTLCGLYIAPLHYYGDEELYDYENGAYGFPFGDVSGVLARKTPMGAGAYRFVGYTGRAVDFEASEYYWKGEPATKAVRFVKTEENGKIDALRGGEADLGLAAGSKAAFRDVLNANENKELRGDALAALPVDVRGYGYIGINADTVNVGGNPGSAASKNLRRAFLTLFSAYREAAVGGYWGGAAYVIEYPVCPVSWAAPQSGDEGYETAYAADAQGKSLVGGDTSPERRRELALLAAIDFFKAAGYTWDGEQEKFTAAPEGAKLRYEAMIQGYGAGDHPCYSIFSEAAAALGSIGITLAISDVEDSRALLGRMNAGTQEIWAGAWESVPDPDMYWTWHSNCIPGRGGSGANYFAVEDSRLDARVLEARRSTDLNYRKSVYKACFGIIRDWACILPVYQRRDLLIANTGRVDTASLTENPTAYWSWLQEIEKLQLR